MLLKKLLFRKSIAVLTATAFLLSSLSTNAFTVFSSKPAVTAAQTASINSNNIILPFNIGKITNSVDYSTKRVVVHIQDLHANPQAQKNIASILALLDKEYGINNVYIEGAPKGNLSTKWLAGIRNIKIRDTIAGTMISGGELSGAEYYSMMSGRTELLKGIENIDIYVDNFLRLGDIEKNRDSANLLLSLMQAKIDTLGRRHYSTDNKKIISLTKKYTNNKISSSVYFDKLCKYAAKYNISLTKYPQILSFNQINSLKKEINNNNLQKEIKNLLEQLKTSLSYKEYKSIIELSNSYETEGFFYLKLQQILHNNNKYKDCPNLEKFFALLHLNQKVNPIELVRQEHMLVNEIRNKSARNSGEREILFMERFASILSALLQNKITVSEYKNYNYSLEDFKRTLNKYFIFNELNALESAINTAEEFYAVNSVRDNYFIEALEGVFSKPSTDISTYKSSQLGNAADMLKKAENIDIIITGGFHTSGISKLLENKHQSFVIITPNISHGTSISEQSYDAAVKRQMTMFNRDAFDVIKQSAAFEISPDIIDPAKAVFAVLFSEGTIRKLYEANILDIDLLQSMINEGYGRKAVDITKIEITDDAIYATVNGKDLIISDGSIMYADEIRDMAPAVEAPKTHTANKKAAENLVIQNAVIDLTVLSLRDDVKTQEIENAFNELNAYPLTQEIISELKKIAQKFPEKQKEYIENKISQRENFGGTPILTIYPAWAEKISIKSIKTAVKFMYSVFIAPFTEAADIMAIASHLTLKRRELKNIISEAKRKAEVDANAQFEQTEEELTPKQKAGLIKEKTEKAIRLAIRELIETKLQEKSPRAEFLLSHSNFKGDNISIMSDALDTIVASTASFSTIKPLAWTIAVVKHLAYNIKAFFAGTELSKDLPSSDEDITKTSIYELMKDNGLGAIFDGNGTNFGVYSKNATKMELCLFDDDGIETRIEMTKNEGTDIWSIFLPEIKPGQKYGFRAHGPYDPDNGHYFNPNKLAVDPYSFQQEYRFIFHEVLRISEKDNVYNMDTRDSAPFVPKSVVIDLRKLDELEIPETPELSPEKSRIYELHVGGFTALKEDLPNDERGTLKGLASDGVIEHLQSIGINTVEAQPIQSDANDPYSYERGLRNNSGYMTVNFFALNPDLGDPSRPGEDLLTLKETIGKLNAAGIRFGMDVVDNHSGEGTAGNDPSLCYRLLDNTSYYLLHPENKAYYDDASGCGNGFNTNSPVVLNMMTKYKEMYALLGVRLFRHDLMAAAARNEETREFDPNMEYMQIFKNSKILAAINEKEGLIIPAEAYMAGGGAKGVPSYHTNNFHKDFFAWNSEGRDTGRNFIMGRSGPRSLGSAIADPNYKGNLYRQPYVHYTVSHDGHTLAQLLAVYEKDNSDNKQDTPNGPDEYGMGLGYDNELIPMYAASAMTLLSFCQGPIMFGMGDEFLRTQHGNNNPYNQSNEYLNMRWDKEAPLAKYMNALAKYRAQHLTLDASMGEAFSGRIVNDNGDKDIKWLQPDGREMNAYDWEHSNFFGFMISGDRLTEEGIYDDDTLVMMNMSKSPVEWVLPESAGEGPWYVYASSSDLEISNNGAEVYNNKYFIMPGESVILYKPRSIESRIKQGIVYFEQAVQNDSFQLALTASFPAFIENIKLTPLKTALRTVYSIFGAPAAEMNEMMMIVSGKITQQDFLEKHKSYVNGNKSTKWAMEKGLGIIIGATKATGGTTLPGKIVNFTLHMMHNAISAITFIATLTIVKPFLTIAEKSQNAVKGIIKPIIAANLAKKLKDIPYVINVDIYDEEIHDRASLLADAGIKVEIIANSADTELISAKPVNDNSFGFPIAKTSLSSGINLYFPGIIGNANAANILDALSNDGYRRVIFEDRIEKEKPGAVAVRYGSNIIAADPQRTAFENVESALQSAKTEYRVNASKKGPVNIDYIFAEELTDLESIKNRVLESADKNFDTIVISSDIDTEILKSLIRQSFNKNIRVMLTHKFTNADMENDLAVLQSKLSSSRVWFNENDFAGIEGIISQFEKIDHTAVQNVERTVKEIKTALNRLTRYGYIGIQLHESNKITDFDFKGIDITNVTLSNINDKRIHPENSTVLLYIDKNSISHESIAPSDIENIIKRFENAETIIMPGWLIDISKNSSTGFNPIEFLRARLGRNNIASTIGEALNKGRIDAIGKGYYLEATSVDTFYKILISLRKGENIEDGLNFALNTMVYHQSLSGKIINTKLADSPIVSGTLLKVLVNYKNEDNGQIALRQFEGIIQGILETVEFKMHIKKEYINRDDFENHALALFEAKLACFEAGIEITDTDTSSDGIPYYKALERLAGTSIEGFGYNKNNEETLPMREHINVLFGVVNDSETTPQDKALALADLLKLLTLAAHEIKITDVFTNRTEVRSIQAILSAA